MKIVKLYISPHFDDVVFSCAGRITADIQRGHEVIIATVFTQANKQYAAEYRTREAENNKAAALLKAKVINLDYYDAPFRHDFYNSFQQIVLEQEPSDNLAFIDRIGDHLSSLCELHNISEVYAPLAVGTHIDHRICFEAARTHIKIALFFYEDRPYATTKFAVQARLQMIGVKNKNRIDQQQYFTKLEAMKYIQRHLPAGNARVKAFNTIKQQLDLPASQSLIANAQIFSLTMNHFPKVTEAVLNYATQIDDFFGCLESYKKQTLTYSNSISAMDRYNERYWTLALAVPVEE